MTVLRQFLFDLKASHAVREALAANTVLHGQYAGVKFAPRSTADVLAGLEQWVDRAEHDDDPLIVEIHDCAVRAVSTDEPLKVRLQAFLAALKPYWKPQ